MALIDLKLAARGRMTSFSPMRSSLLFLALLAAPPAMAAGTPFTVPIGESWIFRLDHGQPAHARKATPATRPRPGEIRVTLRSMMGTTMTLISNSPRSYTYRAILIGADGKEAGAKSCALPPDSRLAFESWPQTAAAVRLSDFKSARHDNACP